MLRDFVSHHLRLAVQARMGGSTLSRSPEVDVLVDESGGVHFALLQAGLHVRLRTQY